MKKEERKMKKEMRLAAGQDLSQQPREREFYKITYLLAISP